MAALDAAEAEYPITPDMEATDRTVRLILREGFVKGYMLRAREDARRNG